MEPAAYGFFGALIGAVVGGATSVITTVLSQRHARKQEERSDSFRRKQRARNLQLEGLLALRDAVTEAQGVWEETRISSEAGVTGSDLYQLRSRAANALAQLFKYSEYPWDEDVRAAAAKIRGPFSTVVRDEVGFYRVMTDADRRFSEGVKEAQAAIGSALDTLTKGDLAVPG